MIWLSVRVRAPGDDREAVVALLFEMGSQGVQEDGDVVITHFPPSAIEPELLRQHLRRVSPRAHVELGDAPDVDWSEHWRDQIRSHDTGRFIVAPPWLARPDDADRTIVIDPGMAFGTGDHASTRGVLRLMPDVIERGDLVADLGAGSAVLAIAAAKLGAGRVIAIELDPDAIGNAQDNVVRNGVGDRVTVVEGDAELLLPLVAPVRVALVNIISSVITQLLPTLGRALSGDGAMVLGGVLTVERDALGHVLRQHGWAVAAESIEGEWWSAIARRR